MQRGLCSNKEQVPFLTSIQTEQKHVFELAFEYNDQFGVIEFLILLCYNHYKKSYWKGKGGILMDLNKKRNRILWFVILISIIVFLFAILINHLDDDEYIISWLFAMSQALFVFAIFRFKSIKDLQRSSNIVWRVTIITLGTGVMVTLSGVLLSEYFLYANAKKISHVGSFIAGLGINGLISYTSNNFDFVEEKENKQHRKKKAHNKHTRK